MRLTIDRYTPDIMCITEANMHKDYLKYAHEFDDYHIELNLMYSFIGVSRNINLIRKGINYQRQNDLESHLICNIWIELLLSKMKKSTNHGWISAVDITP